MTPVTQRNIKKGPGPPGAENASIKPGYATTGNADTYSAKCRCSINTATALSVSGGMSGFRPEDSCAPSPKTKIKSEWLSLSKGF
jgi:hypothetical protein